jgi:Arc/MetJ family transcription regulator
MRTTLILKDDVLARAIELTGIREKTALVHLGLQSLIAQESRRRLIALGGSQKGLNDIPRRRNPPERT